MRNPVVLALGHLYRCKDATRILSQAQDRPLTRFEGWKLRMHLRICIACERFQRQLALMRQALEKYRL